MAKEKWTTAMKQLEVHQYRKFRDISIPIHPGLNVVAGENGVGKSSVLYLISNSFQKISQNDCWIQDESISKVLAGLKERVNLKMESLVRGSRYNDPALGSRGSLYEAIYGDERSLEFRRHNSSRYQQSGREIQRYRLAPFYKKDENYGLPSTPVIYLGLSRLIPVGELEDEEIEIKRIRSLGSQDVQELVAEYEKMTGLDLSDLETVKISSIKASAHFDTNEDGVDSNTISAGQDNLFVILYALQTLKAYSKASDNKPSILLIDEVDASLHPALQIRLLNILRTTSQDYNIQIVFTTHSFTILEDAFTHNDNVLYFQRFPGGVDLLEDPNMEKAEMDLLRITKENLLIRNEIFVLTEDQEARDFLSIMFNTISELDPSFSEVRHLFTLVELSAGAELLKGLFSKQEIWERTPAFAVLDGDQTDPKSVSYNFITLPGGDSPEKLLVEYGKSLIANDSDFWRSRPVIDSGFSHYIFKEQVLDWLRDRIDENGKPRNNGRLREIYKQVYRQHKTGFQMLARHWAANAEHRNQIEKFAKSLSDIFAKNAALVGRSPRAWVFRPDRTLKNLG